MSSENKAFLLFPFSGDGAQDRLLPVALRRPSELLPRAKPIAGVSPKANRQKANGRLSPGATRCVKFPWSGETWSLFRSVPALPCARGGGEEARQGSTTFVARWSRLVGPKRHGRLWRARVSSETRLIPRSACVEASALMASATPSRSSFNMRSLGPETRAGKDKGRRLGRGGEACRVDDIKEGEEQEEPLFGG
jgi:hypothetical protein